MPRKSWPKSKKSPAEPNRSQARRWPARKEDLFMPHTTAEYKSDVKITWCPGCGDFAVLNALYQALATLDLDPKNVVVVSGIGCSGRLPIFVNSYGFHGVHGRVLPT